MVGVLTTRFGIGHLMHVHLSQAAIIARKKEAAAEHLREAREDLHQHETEVSEKRSQVRQGDGEEVLKGEEVRGHSYTFPSDTMLMFGFSCSSSNVM